MTCSITLDVVLELVGSSVVVDDHGFVTLSAGVESSTKVLEFLEELTVRLVKPSPDAFAVVFE